MLKRGEMGWYTRWGHEQTPKGKQVGRADACRKFGSGLKYLDS